MRSNVAGAAWPHISLGMAGSVAALLRQLDQTQWLPAEAVRRAQFAQLGVLSRHLVRTSDHFRHRLRQAGLAAEDLGTPDGLADLPPLRRRDLQDAGADLFASEVPASHAPIAELKSSGSTGEPLTVRRTAVNSIVWAAVTLRDHLWHDIDFRGRISSCRFSVHELRKMPDWGRPISLLFESGPSQTIPLLTPIEEIAALLAAFSPHLLQIYPSVLGPLAEHIVDRGLELPDLTSVHTIGETLPADVRSMATAALGVQVWDTYSCEEVGNVAMECPESRGYHVSEALLLEILDEDDRPCAEGETGRVVATDLHNVATPLIRYDLGDYAEVGAQPCPCGRGLPSLRRLLGRHRNLVQLPDGSRHWPVVGLYKYRDVAPIRQFQFVQRELDAIDVTMVVDRPVTDAEASALTEVIQGALGHPFTLHYTWQHEPLPRSPGGKFEEFRCEL
jgi:phenylacetate-CoA ligase